MKRFLGGLICVMVFQSLCAQTEKAATREVHLGYGLLSDIQMIAAFSNSLKEFTSGISGELVSTSYSSAGPLIIGYNFFTSRKITLGPEINLMQLAIKDHYSSGEIINDRYFVANLSARLDFRYVKREKIQMYSGILLGGSYIYHQTPDVSTANRSTPFLSYQFNFFGIRFGKSWAGFTEFGFGRNGLVNFGISKTM